MPAQSQQPRRARHQHVPRSSRELAKERNRCQHLVRSIRQIVHKHTDKAQNKRTPPGDSVLHWKVSEPLHPSAYDGRSTDLLCEC
jgi:hypothetical protein